MTDEQRAIEMLTDLAKVYKATTAIEDDGSEDVMTQALRRDLPVALAFIDRQAQEIAHLRMIEEAAKEFTAARHAMDAHVPSDESWAQLHRRQRDTQKRLDELLGEGETK